MNLQTKLISAFATLAVLTFGVSLLAYWEVNRLGSALYEVGVVRLPSIQGLGMMTEAMTALNRSAQNSLPTASRDSDITRELDHQQEIWRRFEAGWTLYEPLPQTVEEAAKWRAFVPNARSWRAAHTTAVESLATALRSGNPAALTAARGELATSAEFYDRSLTLLADLTALNYRIADEAKRTSITSYRDMERVRGVMLFAGIGSVASAIGFGVLMGRRLSRPVVAVADAMAKVAGGDLRVRVDIRSRDEIGEMAHAMNRMVEALRTSEARLRLLGDNLPDSVVYQLVREHDGTMRFLHVSAGIERLHGLRAADVLRDPALLYRQILPEDQARVAALEKTSFESLAVFDAVVRVCRADGTIRWMHIGSQPRRLEDGRTIWDGIETDITARKQAEQEMRRANRALRTLSSCNHVLVHAVDEMTFLRDVCRVIVDDGGYRLAWVGYAGHDEHKTVRPVAHAGQEGGYLDKLDITWADTARGQSPMSAAIRSGQPASCQNYRLDPHVALWRAEALGLGLQCSLAFPLRDHDTVFGGLAIYSADPEAFDEQEFKLLAEFASDLSYGIQTLRARRQHQLADAEVRRLLMEAEKARTVLQASFDAQTRTQEALRASEARFRSAMHNSGIGMALIAPDHRLLEVNPALCRIVGLTSEQLLATTLDRITFADDRPAAAGPIAEALANRLDSFECEKRFTHRDGKIIWVHFNASLVRDPRGAPLHFIAQIQDITAAREAALQLAETAERLHVALLASRQGIWRRNLQTGVAEWDTRMKEMFGLRADAPTPDYETFTAYIVPEDRRAIQIAWRDLADSGALYDQQFRIRRADGEIRHINARGILHRDASGRPLWVTGVNADLTEVVRANEESGRLREKLRQAQKMETLGTLAAGIAHDFNNLLTGISGFVELGAASLPPGHEAVELLQQARQGAMSARDLVRRILTFSRLVPEAERAVVQLTRIARETAPLITAGLPTQITLSLNIADNTPAIRADPGQIQQVLLNLCVNGAQAIGGRSGGRIGLALTDRLIPVSPLDATGRGPQPGRYACLAISDNGCGMSAEVCARVFEPFFTTKGASEGTGLGLSVVHDIVTDHGGVVLVHSELGRGTTFEVLLPASDEDTAAVAAPAAALPVRGRGERILVVDDEPTVTAVASRALTLAGYAPEALNSSLEAWNRFVAEPRGYSLILLDHQMPQLTGGEFARRVRHATSTLPIVIMTARTGDLNPADLQRLGGVGLLAKPFELEELIARVGAAIPAQPAADALSSSA